MESVLRLDLGPPALVSRSAMALDSLPNLGYVGILPNGAVTWVPDGKLLLSH